MLEKQLGKKCRERSQTGPLVWRRRGRDRDRRRALRAAGGDADPRGAAWWRGSGWRSYGRGRQGGVSRADGVWVADAVLSVAPAHAVLLDAVLLRRKLVRHPPRAAGLRTSSGKTRARAVIVAEYPGPRRRRGELSSAEPTSDTLPDLRATRRLAEARAEVAAHAGRVVGARRPVLDVAERRADAEGARAIPVLDTVSHQPAPGVVLPGAVHMQTRCCDGSQGSPQAGCTVGQVGREVFGGHA